MLPYLARATTAQLDVHRIDTFWGEREAAGLSPRSVNMLLDPLAQVLDDAVECGLLEANPARGKRRRLKVPAVIRRRQTRSSRQPVTIGDRRTATVRARLRREALLDAPHPASPLKAAPGQPAHARERAALREDAGATGVALRCPGAGRHQRRRPTLWRP